METDTFLTAIMTVTLAGVTFNAWRMGNEQRDVALLGTLCALCGVGTVATWIV